MDLLPLAEGYRLLAGAARASISSVAEDLERAATLCLQQAAAERAADRCTATFVRARRRVLLDRQVAATLHAIPDAALAERTAEWMRLDPAVRV
jgi:hypothetical protein